MAICAGSKDNYGDSGFARTTTCWGGVLKLEDCCRSISNDNGLQMEAAARFVLALLVAGDSLFDCVYHFDVGLDRSLRSRGDAAQTADCP